MKDAKKNDDNYMSLFLLSFLSPPHPFFLKHEVYGIVYGV